MKQLFSVLLLVTFFLSTSSFTDNSGKNQFLGKSRIEVVFNRQLDFNDIVKIKLDLSQNGIVIKYRSLVFDENGKLKSIDFYVDCKDGFSGSASNNNLLNQSHFGFYRHYSKDAKSPFGTGGF